MRIFFFNDTATTEIYTLSLHDALPISTFHKILTNKSFRMHSIVSQSDVTESLYLGDLLSADYENDTDRFKGVLKEKDVLIDRKSTRLNSSHANISYAVFCLKKKTRSEA